MVYKFLKREGLRRLAQRRVKLRQYYSLRGRLETLPEGTSIRYIGSTKRVAARTGALYGFVYSRKTATDRYPIILVCKPSLVSNYWYSRAGNRYMSGFNMNYMIDQAPGALALIMEKFGELNHISYKTVTNVSMLTASYFRTYDVRRVQDLYLIDVSKYMEGAITNKESPI
jgi:hypothetical protein